MNKEDVVHTHTHAHTVEYYSAIKKNKIMLLGYNLWGHKESNTTERLSPAQHTTPFAAFWIGPEIAIMSEVSPKEKGEYHMVIYR